MERALIRTTTDGVRRIRAAVMRRRSLSITCQGRCSGNEQADTQKHEGKDRL
jgi:hypothetical protein